MTRKDRILDLLERLFMPWTWQQRKRMTPVTDKFEERMLKFREGKNGEPEPVQRGAVTMAALLVLAVCYGSLMSSGSGCATSPAPSHRAATSGHAAPFAALSDEWVAYYAHRRT